MKEKAIEKISKNEDVLFCWSVVSTNWEEEAVDVLLMIIEKWVTVRGFHLNLLLEGLDDVPCCVLQCIYFLIVKGGSFFSLCANSTIKSCFIRSSMTVPVKNG